MYAKGLMRGSAVVTVEKLSMVTNFLQFMWNIFHSFRGNIFCRNAKKNSRKLRKYFHGFSANMELFPHLATVEKFPRCVEKARKNCLNTLQFFIRGKSVENLQPGMAVM